MCKAVFHSVAVLHIVEFHGSTKVQNHPQTVQNKIHAQIKAQDINAVTPSATKKKIQKKAEEENLTSKFTNCILFARGQMTLEGLSFVKTLVTLELFTEQAHFYKI